MNELKPCPFCFGQADQSCVSGPVECVDCHATASDADSWNTRAAPTMRKWEWSEGDGANEVWACLDFDAYVYRDGDGTDGTDGLWHAYVDGRCCGHYENPETGKVACVAYVEGKLKDWLV